MGNSFGALLNSLLVHDLVEDLVTDLDPFFGLATDFATLPTTGGVPVRSCAPGSVITIKDWKPSVTIYDMNPAVGYAAADVSTAADKPFTMPSTVTAASMKLTPEEYRILISSTTGVNGYDTLRERWKNEALQKLAEAMVTKFNSKVTAGNFPNYTVIPTGTFNRQAENKIDKALFKRKLLSRANATSILEPDAYEEWSNDHIAVHTNTGATQTDRILSRGVKSSVTALTHWRTNVPMPVAAPRGMVFTKTAMGFVARLPDEPTFERDPVSLMEVVHPKHGFGVLARVWKDPKLGHIQFDLAFIYDFYALQAEALERLLAVAP